MAKVVGIVKVFINGELQRSKDGAKISLGGKERTIQTGYAVFGHSEKVVPSMVEFTLANTADDDLIALGNLTDATVRFETDVGRSYVCTGMVVTKVIELTGGEGEVSIEMQGQPADEEGLI